MPRRLPLVLVALVATLLLTGCDTQPATNITATSATLNAKGGCSGTETGSWQYQIREVGGTFRDVGTPMAFTCGGATAEGALQAVTVSDLSPGRTYEYRIRTVLSNGNVLTYDSAGTQGGTAYDRFSTPAAAATGGYAWRTETCGTNRGHGESDVNGVMYAACGTKIVRFGLDGSRLADVTVAGLSFSTVAPSPDGAYLYANVSNRLVRLDRQANGTYAKNATWAPKAYSLNNVSYKPVPRNVATDEFGNIYISNAGTDPDSGAIAPTRILKYAPNGTLMTAFGEHNDDPANPYAFYQNRGLAVTRDGRSIYVTSHLQGQVRRFAIQANGEYAYAQTIGAPDTNCATGGGLAAPSDVAVDPWGFVYIPDTTCKKIKKFRADGTLLAVIGTGPTVLHEIGVTRRGDVFAAEWNRFYARTADNPAPATIPAITKPVIDVTAPVLASVSLPATTTTRSVQVGITATDAVGVAQVRLANEDGTWGAWKAFTNPMPHTLTAGATYKVVYVQVRDAAGNESGVLSASTRLTAAPVTVDTTAPTLANVTVPATTTTQSIAVTITASDDVAITQVRLANEDGTWGAWKAYAPTVQHTLSAGYSIKGVYVQVRDAAGNESGVLYRTLRYQAG